MIHTDADGSMMLLADVEERYEAILNLLKFVGILLVGIFLLDELAGRIHVVARIYAHFFTIESSHVGNVRIEMNIGYERSLIAVGTDAGIVSALIVGDKTALQSDRTEAYRATGTAHLLAISGFHTGIIAAILGLFVPKRKRWLRTVFVGIGLIMYCCIAVYAAGIVRASIMVICALLCRALNRRADSLNGLAAAAVLILAFEPFQLYSVGFQLSFAACFGLILFSKQFETALASAHIPLAGSVSACLGASIATAPFQAAYFGCLPLYFVAGNLIAVPLFSLVMVLCIAILIIGIPFPGFAAVLAVAPRAVLFVVERCLGFLSALPYASLDLPTIPLASCALFLAMLFVLSPYVLRPFQKRAGLAVFCLLLFTGSLVFSIITL